MVGERCVLRRSKIVKSCGAHTSENAGMSSEMRVRTPHTV